MRTCEILLDTGIMSGADIVAAVALGARFTLVGRAYLYGLMAGGEAGVERAIDILSTQVSRTMRLLGVTSLDELKPRHVTQLRRLAPRDSMAAPKLIDHFIHTGHSQTAHRRSVGLCAESESLANRDVTSRC